MFPESPTKDFAAKARLIAEGYRKARADAQRPGDIVVNELDQQLRALEPQLVRSEDFAWTALFATSRLVMKSGSMLQPHTLHVTLSF